MGLPIYWLNGLSLEMSCLNENVCCIYSNPYYSEKNHIKYDEKKYTCEIILAPYHESRIIGSFMYLKDAQAWGIEEFNKLVKTTAL